MKRRPRKRGPKPIKINWQEFDTCCGLNATLEEIAAYFNCSPDTIERRVKEEYGVKFADYHAQKDGIGKVSIRRRMMQVAMAGNVTMLIFLAKNRLDMHDNVKLGQAETTKDDGPAPWKVEIMGFAGKSEQDVTAAMAAYHDKPIAPPPKT